MVAVEVEVPALTMQEEDDELSRTCATVMTRFVQTEVLFPEHRPGRKSP